MLSGFLKAPLIAGRIHDAAAPPRATGRRTFENFNGARRRTKQSCGEYGVIVHGSPLRIGRASWLAVDRMSR